MKNNSALVTNNTSTRKRRYIAKRLGSAMTVGFAPLKRKYSNDHNHNNENSNSHNSQDTDGSERDTKRRTMHPTYDNPMQLMEDDDEELDENMSTTSSSTTTAMSKDIYITRSGRQVRPMVMKEPSSEDLYEEYEYDDGNDNTESIKIKNQGKIKILRGGKEEK
ncbi:hypothetical protein BDA99DRAFT_106714 [Phascolomyces articulosus]|uniref:Uncharacterized protein n=1 Tax=Phascolomyces articulosus TaxID=60185 RepID=A0AAD5JXR1_9FUNG|nr:hypothetical protein BDA99DRAFT_106714 [Phascolomyces articulosus]